MKAAFAKTSYFKQPGDPGTKRGIPYLILAIFLETLAMAFQFSRHSRAQVVLEELDAANHRLNDEDRARKYQQMSGSPYLFLRGTNHLFWRDAWQDWRYYLFGGVIDTQTWLQGDAHVYNQGSYGDDTSEPRYGMDDFDDAVIADYQFDLWRFATSMVLDGRENVGLSKDEIRRAIFHLLTAYLDELEAHQDGREAASLAVAKMKKPLGSFMKKVAKKKGAKKQLGKWTICENGERRFDLSRKKLGGLSDEERNRLEALLEGEYLSTLALEESQVSRPHFEVKDIAKRLNAGTGSLGRERYYVLIEGGTEGHDDDIVLDVKEQTPPPAYHFMSEKEKQAWTEAFENEGQRHAVAFRALADHPDEYLGWFSLGEKSYSVRQHSPYKNEIATNKIGGFKSYRRLARAWGRIMAREHIRGARSLRPDDPIFFCRAVLDRCNKKRDVFQRAVATTAFTYAQCATQDHAVFVAERCGGEDGACGE